MGQRPGAAVLQVFIFKDGQFVGTDLFSERQVVVGRDPSVADLVLESTQVSRKHALLEHDGMRVVIRDAGSTNGIFINSKKIENAELGRLDEVVVGEFSLKVKLVTKGKPESAEAPATRIASAVDAPASRSGASRPREDSDRSTRMDDAPPAAMRQAGAAKSALADWDDVLSEHMPRPSAEELSARSARAKRHPDPPSAERGVSKRPRPAAAEEARAPARSEERSGRSKRPAAEARSARGGLGEEEAFATTADEEPVPSALLAQSGGAESSEAATLDGLDEPPPGAGEHGEDDEEEDDESFVPPYSLINQLVQSDPGLHKGENGKNGVCVEVMSFRNDIVEGAHLLHPGDSFWIGPDLGLWPRLWARGLPPRIRLLKYKRPGKCRIEVRAEQDGTIRRGEDRMKLSEAEGGMKRTREGTRVMGLRAGEILDLVDGRTRYHVRFVSPPEPLPDERPWYRKLFPEGAILNSLGGSLGTHLMMLIVVGIFAAEDVQKAVTPEEEEFVEVALEAEPDTKETKEEKPKDEAKPADAPQNNEAKPSRKKPRFGGASSAPAGVLGLLSKRGSSAAPGPMAAIAAVSNLRAARAPGGSAGYMVSGLIGKLPSNQLSVGGGGGGLLTKGGAALLRGGGGGGGLARGTGTKGVGGLVQKNPGAMRSVGQGFLDRDEIQKVINANIGQIQRCYERELLKSPGLSGKIQVEWTIATSGRVRACRQTYTSMNSTSVANCIMDSIRGWVFPQPKGGEVIVNYPFIFKSIGF